MKRMSTFHDILKKKKGSELSDNVCKLFIYRKDCVYLMLQRVLQVHSCKTHPAVHRHICLSFNS